MAAAASWALAPVAPQMALAPTFGDYVRAAGGLAYLAFGVYVLLQKPRTPRSRALGGMLATLGCDHIVSNLVFSSPDLTTVAIGVAIAIPFDVAFLVIVGVFLRQEAGERARWLRWVPVASLVFAIAPLAVALAGGIVGITATRGLDPDDPRAIAIGSAALGAGYATTFASAAVLWVLAHAAERSRTRREFAATAVLAMGLALWPITFASLLSPSEGHTETMYLARALVAFLSVAPFLPGIIAWSRAGTREDKRSRRALLATLVGVPVAWLALPLFADPRGGGNVAWALLDSAFGVTRFIGIAILAYGVFTLDWLGLGRPEKKDRHAFLATAALAVLFIVAQVAENLIDDRYSLVLGGVIAGAFLVAARPIERAIERVTFGARQEAGAPPGIAPDAQEERYRNAVRLALRDRVVTRDEEHHLFALAQGLGLSPERAHKILVEVEREET